MDTRTTALPNAYPHPRRPVVQQARMTIDTTDRHPPTIGTQSAGLDQSIVGAVNASRIAALAGSQGLTSTERPVRTDDDASSAYRKTQAATMPVKPTSLAS